MKNNSTKWVVLSISILMLLLIVFIYKVKQYKPKRIQIVKKENINFKSSKISKPSNKKSRNNISIKNPSNKIVTVSTIELKNNISEFQKALQKAKSSEYKNPLQSALETQLIDWKPRDWEAIKKYFHSTESTNEVSDRFLMLVDVFYSNAGKISNRNTEKICEKLLKISEAAINKEFALFLMNQVATIESKIKNYDKAINISKRSLNKFINENINDPTLATMAGTRIINSYAQTGKYEDMQKAADEWKASVKSKKLPDNEYFTLEFILAMNYIQPKLGNEKIIRGVKILKELKNKLIKTKGISPFIRNSIEESYNKWKDHPSYISFKQKLNNN